MPRRFVLHETIDIVGQGQYEYMDRAAREPVKDMPGLFRLQGTFFVIGASGGRWPQCINLHDGGPDGWDAWTRNLDRLNLCLLYTSPSPRDKRQSRMPSSA